MNNTWKSYLQLSMAMFFAGSTVVAGKLIVNKIPIFLSQGISLFFALIVIIPLACFKEGSIFKCKIKKMDLFWLFMQGLTGIFMFRIFILLGLKYTSAIESGIITSTTPALLAVFSFLFLKEKLDKVTVSGIGLCVFGIIVINTSNLNGAIQSTFLSIIGNSFILIAVIGEVLFTIFRKKQSFSNRPLTSTSYVILFSFILFLPIALYEMKKFDLSQLSFLSYLPMIYYGVFCSAIGYTCWFSGIAKVPVSVAAGFSGVMPISSVALSTAILNERLTWQHIIGIAMTIIGIYIISFRRRFGKCSIKKTPNNSSAPLNQQVE